MRKLDFCLLFGLFIAVISANAFSFSEKCEGIEDSVLRFHILANSDSEADQTLKLKVRDAVLEGTDGWFADCASVPETEQVIAERIDEIEEIASRTISAEGYSYPVSCKLVHMDFDARVYDNFTMPPGDYDALRITIGEAGGKNWWCVMYPPLCLPAAMDLEEFKDEFTAEELEMLQNPQNFQVKFKCVELYQQLKIKLEKLFNSAD